MADEIKIEVKCGYVAFFDILGYREMTSRQDFTAVVEALKGAQQDAEELLTRKSISNCDLFTFGDSMIVFCAGDSEDSTLDSALQLPIYCRKLFTQMFNRGMPIRGAIAKGEFYFKGNSYAGQPLNEAYEYANNLEFAGCVLTPSAEDLVTENLEADPSSTVLRVGPPNFKKVSVPIKSQGKQTLYVLTQRIKPTRERVLKAFQRHGKIVTPAVLPKLNNTIEVLGEVYDPVKIPMRPKK